MLLFALHLPVFPTFFAASLSKVLTNYEPKTGQKLQYGQYGRVQKLEETADLRGGTLKSSSRKSRI